MSLELLILGAYAYTTLLLVGGASAFLYIASWLREIALNHIPHLDDTMREMRRALESQQRKIDILMR